MHGAVIPVLPRLERHRDGLRADEAGPGDHLVFDARPVEREVVDVRFVGDDKRVLAVPEHLHCPAAGVLERDRVAGTDRPFQLRQGRRIHDRSDTDRYEPSRRDENSDENN